MKTPRRWLEAHPTCPEALWLREVAGEAPPAGALSRAAKRIGVTATVLSAASSGLAHASAAHVTSAATATTTVSSSVALWGTLGKATAVGICVGALGIGMVQEVVRWTPGAVKAAVPTMTASPKSAGGLVRMPKDAPTLSTNFRHEPSDSRKDAADFERLGQPRVRHPRAEGPQGMATSGAEQPQMLEPLPSALGRLSDVPEVEAQAFAAPVFNQSASAAARPQLGAGVDDQPSSAQGTSSSLAREVRALDAVRQALARGDGPGALSILNLAEQQGPFQRLGREAAVLRVEALGAAGRLEDADRLSRILLQQSISQTQRRVLERWVSAPHK